MRTSMAAAGVTIGTQVAVCRGAARQRWTLLGVMVVGTAVVAIGAGAWYMVRRVRAAPQVTRLDPSTGRIGDELSVCGQHLPTVGLAVVFGGNRPAELLAGRTRVRVRVPPSAPDGSVAVRARGGSATSAMFTVAHAAGG
jgi:hypothetical protein